MLSSQKRQAAPPPTPPSPSPRRHPVAPLGQPVRSGGRTNTISLASWASLFCFAMRAHRSMAPRSTDNIIDPDGHWPPAATQNALLLSSTRWLAVVRRRRCGGDSILQLGGWRSIRDIYLRASSIPYLCSKESSSLEL